jgi:hypothetical protein
MRNDARPIGEDSPASPVGGHESPIARESPESRDRRTHDRPHVVNQAAGESTRESSNDRENC